VITVTHDRYFLDNIATWMLEIDHGQCHIFEGNYTSWLSQKQKRMDLDRTKEASRAKQLARELEWIRSNRGGRNKARERAYEDLVADSSNRVDRVAGGMIAIPPGPRLGDSVVEVAGASWSYGNRLLFQNLDFRLERGAVVGIVGPNGAGKSTIFQLLTGELTPCEGTITIGDTVRMGCVTQGRADLVDDRTVYESIAEGVDALDMGGGNMVSTRAYCALFNFRGSLQEKAIRHLSGGERNRVHLAKLVKGGYNVLLLDEPTNDLDVDTLRSLEDALPDFPGCAVVISHDRWFLDRICTHILAFENDGHVEFYPGNFSEYEVDRKRRGVQVHYDVEANSSKRMPISA